MFEQDEPITRHRDKKDKTLIKSLVMLGLVLIMLIPTSWVQSLIAERQDRQHQVVEEVSDKWAKPQRLSAPYLVIPYTSKNEPGVRRQLIILPEQLNVKGDVNEEDRQRSIFKVLLYRATLNFSGSFHFNSSNLDTADLLYKEARLCFGLTDFRGIEDKISIDIGNTAYTLTPGLPTNVIDNGGLSTQVEINAEDLTKGVDFKSELLIRGSGGLHFFPAAAYSSYEIKSSWPNPSFDGNTLPLQHNINGTGFLANWKFNAANLPFANIITTDKIEKSEVDFGVTLVQPTDQYVKSTRSAKYAILIIGLTFALFFVFELLQKRPVHPVQYALVGVALVIFYTLLVSLSEIILFDYAYLIAAGAITLLITFYAKAHFENNRAAVTVAFLLAGLYSFIYVLISLEDTALLVGSIALFIVVAIIMYATRKINWYQPEAHSAINFQP